MELSERIIATLESEGCITISEETLGSNTLSPSRTVSSPIALIVTDGSIEVTYNNMAQILEPGNRLDIPVQTPFSVIAGKSGSNYVVGEF